MMLELSFGLAKEADMITGAVEETVKEGCVTADLDDMNPCSTTAVGERICSRLREFSV